MSKRDLRTRSFCGKREDQVAHLIGPQDSVFIFICDECVDLYADMLSVMRTSPEEEGDAAPARVANPNDRFRRDYAVPAGRWRRKVRSRKVSRGNPLDELR